MRVRVETPWQDPDGTVHQVGEELSLDLTYRQFQGMEARGLISRPEPLRPDQADQVDQVAEALDVSEEPAPEESTPEPEKPKKAARTHKRG